MKKKLIALILIAVVSTLSVLVYENGNLALALKVEGYTVKVTSSFSQDNSPHVNIRFTNPTQFTLYNCEITVLCLESDNATYKKVVFYEYRLDPFEVKNRILSVDSLSPNIDNVKNGFICEGYGYLRDLPIVQDIPYPRTL